MHIKELLTNLRETSKLTQKIDSELYPPYDNLDGPYRDKNGIIYYYDPKNGKYYDPKSDIYLNISDLDL